MGISVGGESVWVTVAGMGVECDPQAERVKERRRMEARKR
jgi:hypothetical protein